MKKSLISVIVPVYNVEKYLSRCIESIIKQTYRNLDILIIDDGSTDESGTIADNYSKMYEYIRVVHKKNEGIGPTRNLGMSLAKGEYVLFVDSDDYIDEKMIEMLYNASQTYESDLVCCNKFRVYEKNKKGMQTNLNLEEIKILSVKEALSLFLLTNYVDVVFWNKLIKKDLLKTIKCPNHIYEDVFVIYKIILQANKVVCLNAPLYYYCQREASITDENYNDKMILLKEAVDENYNEIKRIYPEIENQLILGKIHWYIVIYDKIILNKGKNHSLKKEIKWMIKSNIKNILQTNLMSKSKKIQYVLLLISDILYRFSYKFFYKLKR